MTRKKLDRASPPKPSADVNKVGYKKPPLSGRIKKGEVRNPHGRTGKPKVVRDALEMALSQPAIIGGEQGTAEQVIYLQQVARATKGDIGSFNAIMKAMALRAAAGPPPLTPREIAAEAADLEKRREITASLIATLETLAELKRDGVLAMTPGKTALAPWVYDAMRMFRESLGEAAVPGKNGRWQPDAYADVIALPRPIDPPVG